MAGIFKAYDIRGIYPEQLDGKIAEKIGRAFAVFTGAKKVVVGRDIRPHGTELFNGLVAGLTAQGWPTAGGLMAPRLERVGFSYEPLAS